MKQLQVAAVLCALTVPIGCIGPRGIAMRVNTTHYAAVRPMPPLHLVVNAKEYQYDTVGVTSGTQTRAFMLPQRVTTDANGVTVVDVAGRTFSFPSGSIVSHGNGTYYLLPGAKHPAWLSRARYVKTLTRADI